jgi:gliding motility-associated-like protein
LNLRKSLTKATQFLFGVCKNGLILSEIQAFQMMKKMVVIYLLMVFCLGNFFAQESYNNCIDAMDLCPLQTYSVNNIDANKTFCPSCEDDFSFCFTANNTIWFKFTTNTYGGIATVNFSNLVFQNGVGQGSALQATVFDASVPCQADSYIAMGNCESAGAANFTLTVDTLLPNTTYYIVVNGDIGTSAAAECTFDISVTGDAVDRSAAAIQLDNTVTSVCLGQTYTAIAYPQNCPQNSTFKWYVNSVFVAETPDPFFQASDLQDGDVITVETDCYAQCSEHVTVTSGPISVYGFSLVAGPDLYLKPGATGQLQAATTATEYIWTPSYHISDTLSLTPFVFPDQTTTYTISATQNGCTQYAYVTVYIDDPLVIPTTFSPNGDDINDTWEIGGVDEFPNCFVQIFDRWGQELFQATGYNDKKAWNGTFKDEDAAEGVYFYIVKLRDSENKEYRGSITLIR